MQENFGLAGIPLAFHASDVAYVPAIENDFLSALAFWSSQRIWRSAEDTFRHASVGSGGPPEQDDQPADSGGAGRDCF